MTNLSYNRDTNEFQVEREFHVSGKTIKGYAIHDYYGKNKFAEVDQDIKYVRRQIWDFKDGNNPTLIASKIAAAIKSKAFPLANSVLVIIPASTVNRTTTRFFSFCAKLSAILGIANGYTAITTVDHEQTKGHSSGNKIEPFTFNPSVYYGKTVYLLDDICTSGTTFKQVAAELLDTGALSVTGIFLGITVSTYTASHGFFDDADFDMDWLT